MVAKPTNALSLWTLEEFFGPSHWEAGRQGKRWQFMHIYIEL